MITHNPSRAVIQYSSSTCSNMPIRWISARRPRTTSRR
jgi:hypothetical protein